MMTTTLISNGATVFIIGPKQADLDRCAMSRENDPVMFVNEICL